MKTIHLSIQVQVSDCGKYCDSGCKNGFWIGSPSPHCCIGGFKFMLSKDGIGTLRCHRCLDTEAGDKLDKPARVNNMTFQPGVSEQLVIEAAQRHYTYMIESGEEVKRIADGKEKLDVLRRMMQVNAKFTQPTEETLALAKRLNELTCERGEI